MQITELELLDLVALETLVDRKRLFRDAALSDLGITSLDLITLLFEVEERYGVVIEDGELPMSNVGEMVDHMIGRINGAARAPVSAAPTYQLVPGSSP